MPKYKRDESPDVPKIRFRVWELIQRVEAITGERTNQVMVARASGVPQGTLSRWSNSYVQSIDLGVAVKLVRYFQRFFPCTLDDLFEVVDES
jgi:hypothetical protein